MLWLGYLPPYYASSSVAVSGAYTLSGSGILTVSGTAQFGRGYGTAGYFTQTGGSSSIGALQLTDTTTCTGTCSLSGGLMILGGLAAGPGAAAFNFSGGTLRAGSGLSSSVPMTLSNGGGGATFDTAGYAVTLAGPLSGSGSLTIIGSGTLLTGAANTFSGGLFVNAGTLTINGGVSGGNGEYPDSAITVARGAVLAVNVTDGTGYAVNLPITVYGTLLKSNAQSETLFRPMTLSGGTLTSTTVGAGTPGGAWNFFGNYIATAAGTSNYISGIGDFSLRTSSCYFNLGANSSLTISVPVSQNANTTATPLNLQGSGVLCLTASNIYTGATDISGGTLQLGNGASGNDGSLNTSGITNNAALVYNLFGSQSANYSISGSGALTKAGVGTLTLSGNILATGDTTVSGGTLVLNTPTFNTYQGGQINIDGASTLLITQSGGYGRYDFGNQTFNFDAAGGGRIITGSGLNWVWDATNTFQTNGGARDVISGLSAMNLNNGPGVVFNVARGTDATSDLTVAVSMGNSDGGLTKTGKGILQLTASNYSTGPTTINQGELVVDGLLASPVTVDSGGTLGGSGYLGSVTVSPSGTLAPGDPLGVLHLSGNLVFSAGGVMDFELDGVSTADEVSMPSGSLTFSGQQFSDFGFTWSAGFRPGNYTLVNAGSISGLGSNISGSIDGLPATLSVQGSGNNQDLVLNVTPEPSTFAMLAAGAIGLVGYGWRRRRTTRRTGKPTAFDRQDAPVILAFPSPLSPATAARRAA